MTRRHEIRLAVLIPVYECYTPAHASPSAPRAGRQAGKVVEALIVIIKSASAAAASEATDGSELGKFPLSDGGTRNRGGETLPRSAGLLTPAAAAAAPAPPSVVVLHVIKRRGNWESSLASCTQLDSRRRWSGGGGIIPTCRYFITLAHN